MSGVGWFSDIDTDDGVGEYVWQPRLETRTGLIPSIDIWFRTKAECDDFIRETIVGHDLLPD